MHTVRTARPGKDPRLHKLCQPHESVIIEFSEKRETVHVAKCSASRMPAPTTSTWSRRDSVVSAARRAASSGRSSRTVSAMRHVAVTNGGVVATLMKIAAKETATVAAAKPR